MEAVAQKLNVSEIIKDYNSRLMRFIKKRVNRVEDAEDILQEVFCQLAEADRLMKPIDQITAWLFTVARNRITDLYRKKKPDLFDEQYADGIEEIEFPDLRKLLVDKNETPEYQYLRNLIWEELYHALEELPPEQREVFELTEFKGRSFKEIAAETGDPVNTLISRKRYAVLHLREKLKTLYDELLEF